jgi:hypothetical protein
MKDERKNAERKFWQSIARMAQESGKRSEWEYLGYSCSSRRIYDLIGKFHQDPMQPGFYGMRIPVGEVGGLQVNLIIENQKELIFGIQLDQQGEVGEPDESFHAYRELFDSLVGSGRDWNFDSPGWLAWKTPEIRLNFRSYTNRAFEDIIRNEDNSEALYLIAEEVSDLLEEVSQVVESNKTVAYGTLVN